LRSQPSPDGRLPQAQPPVARAAAEREARLAVAATEQAQAPSGPEVSPAVASRAAPSVPPAAAPVPPRELAREPPGARAGAPAPPAARGRAVHAPAPRGAARVPALVRESRRSAS